MTTRRRVNFRMPEDRMNTRIPRTRMTTTRMPQGSISKLFINVNVTGDVEFNITNFEPKMINRTAATNYIYFVPTVPITFNNLVGANIIYKKDPTPSDFMNVFTNPYQLNRVLRYIKQDSKFTPITLETAKEKGFIQKDIELILSIFFNDGNKLIYRGSEYPIYSYDWDGKYVEEKTIGRFPNYRINLTLSVLNSRKTGTEQEKKKLDCQMRKRRILKTLGIETTPIQGIKRLPSLTTSGPVTYKHSTSYTRYNDDRRYDPYRRYPRDYPIGYPRDYSRDYSREYPRDYRRDYPREYPRDYSREYPRDYRRRYETKSTGGSRKKYTRKIIK